jgi:hypothetical protein
VEVSSFIKLVLEAELELGSVLPSVVVADAVVLADFPGTTPVYVELYEASSAITVVGIGAMVTLALEQYPSYMSCISVSPKL